jgi:hypothetical protein
MFRRNSIVIGQLVIGLVLIEAAWACHIVEENGGVTSLRFQNGQPFHTTSAVVTDATCVAVPTTAVLLGLWNEHPTPQETFSYYAIARNGVDADRVRMTSYDLRLQFASFDPLAGIPAVPPQLQADGTENLYIVQLLTQPLPEFRQAIETLGGTVRNFVANHGHIVEMTPAIRTQVAALPTYHAIAPCHCQSVTRPIAPR